jgi:tyrosyl-tRNA synthetase
MTETDTEELLTRRVHDVIVKDNLEKRLRKDEKLVIKFGRDARKPTLTLGHAVPILKLREFQQLGHKIVIVLGDFTSRLGDPDSENVTRAIMDADEIASNVLAIRKIFDKILDPETTSYVYNSEWLETVSFGDVISLASNFTVQQNLERDLFQKRLKSGIPIGVQEFLYPILQAYDSIAITEKFGHCDLELGGTDQTFNLLAGRALMKAKGLPPQDILITPMILGTDGKEMHSSQGNYISLADSPFDMYGRLMGIPDSLIVNYLALTTTTAIEKVKEIDGHLRSGSLGAIAAKKILANEVVSFFHGASESESAKREFESVIQGKGIPENRIKYELGEKSGINIVELLAETGLASSKSDARRLVEQGGVDLVEMNSEGEITNRHTINDVSADVSPGDRWTIVQVGKRKAVELKT